MSYLTPRKRAEALGSAKDGTWHHWNTIVSSVALLVLVPLFVFTIGPILGRPYPEAVASLSRPFVAIVVGLTLLVGLLHFRQGVQVVLEDYAKGATRKGLVIAAVCLTYALLAIGLLAVARLSF